MAPTGSRKGARERAEQAARMRATGATWDRIADHLGYRSRQGAETAVRRYRERNPLEATGALRHNADTGYEITKATLFAVMTEAKRQGDAAVTIAAAKVINDTIARQVNLLGLAVPVDQKVQVGVNVDAAAAIEQAEAALLRLADGLSSGRAALPAQSVLDAEVVTEVER